ncbi:hypothetical protein ONZ45_g18964 [Pleurotus djamor]|nr:hypothetical protein ONZ45_g18964 [Pleurotus djamor]
MYISNPISPPDDVSSFRLLQATSDLLIAGSFALRFIDWNVTGLDNEPLDLFVYHEDCLQLVTWLKSARCTLHMPTYPGKTVQDILIRNVSEFPFALGYIPDFDGDARYQGVVLRGGSDTLREKTLNEMILGSNRTASIIVVLQYLTPSKKMIRVHVCAINALAGVLCATSTGGMNIISAHHAYCIFPRETLQKRMLLSMFTPCRLFNILPTLRTSGYWKIISSDDDREWYDVFETGFHETLQESGFHLETDSLGDRSSYVAYDP